MSIIRLKPDLQPVCGLVFVGKAFSLAQVLGRFRLSG